MTISLSDAGKRFNRDWIFRHFNYTFDSGQSYAITGPNGSGKSTLLQALSGGMMLNEGSIEFRVGSQESGVSNSTIISSEKIYNHISICAPYLEVVEEMTLKEFLEFHQGFKPFLKGITADSIIADLGLEKAINKQIRYYSSGMKQRVKLAQCIFSDTAIVLLDEPCTNLDAAGIALYHSLIETYCKDRIVIVSSNDEVEYRFCEKKINMSDYKK
ncbi:MAG TPA: ATP-binding cassette domain-containing protein [Chitinophagaceae bacterium]|nr:ATP-binding cassette domain-containing protein [Chitinophagaceae bacterium]